MKAAYGKSAWEAIFGLLAISGASHLPSANAGGLSWWMCKDYQGF